MSGTVYFVSGTDTGVGKTLVSAGLVAALRRAGRRAVAVKPIETGCHPGPDGLVGADATLLEVASHSGELPLPPVPGSGHSPWYRFAPPVSPHVAAARARVHIDSHVIAQAVADLAAHCDVVIVEGAGGLLVPVARYITMADLAKRMAARLLVVARASLGTLNHSLLTLHAAASHGVLAAGVILNHATEPDPGDASADSNAEELGKLTDVPVWGPLPHIAIPQALPDRVAHLADWVANHVPIRRL